MKLNPINQYTTNINKIKSTSIHSIAKDDTIESKKHRDNLNVIDDNDYTLYTKLGKIAPSVQPISPLDLDKGTASDTTIIVNRASFDSIASYSTFNEPKWEELGSDSEKNWVVINGQRFEVPHSPEEKARIKKMTRSIVEIFDDYDKEKEANNKLKTNTMHKDKLKENKQVLEVLGKVFGVDSFDEIWNTIT
jgi:hypothetical protein